MERLTDKTSVEFNPECSKVNPLTTNGKCPYYDKLAEFENFMEEQGFESLEKLKKCFEIWNSEDDNGFLKDTDNRKLFLYRFAKNLFRYEKDENQALKDRWQKLKEWLEDRRDENGCKYFDNEMIEDVDILEKMQELEKEIKC